MTAGTPEQPSEVALDPDHPGHAEAEIFNMWFLQRRGAEDPG